VGWAIGFGLGAVLVAGCYGSEHTADDDDSAAPDGDADVDADVDADAGVDAGDEVDAPACVDLPSPWRLETPDPESLGWATIGVGPDGAASIVYTMQDASLRFATHAADGWTIDILPVDGTGTSLEPPVFDATGAAHVSFREGSGDVRYATNASGAWTAEVVGHVDRQDGVDFGGTSRVAVAPDGSPRVVYADFAGLWEASPVDGAWSLQAIPGGDPAHYHAAAVSPDGALHVVWVTDSWHVRHATDAAGDWSVQTLDEDLGHDETVLMNMTITPQLSFDGDDLLIAYHAIGELRSFRITPDGAIEARDPVPTAGLDEASLAFVLEPPSTWHVSYVTGKSDIRYARLCDEGWDDVLAQGQPAASFGSGGFWAPLAVSADGMPVLVYFGQAAFDNFFSFQPKVLFP
jgi:hypothetical protein